MKKLSSKIKQIVSDVCGVDVNSIKMSTTVDNLKIDAFEAYSIDTSIYQRFRVHPEWETIDELVTGVMQCLSSDIISIVSTTGGVLSKKVKLDSDIREVGIDAWDIWKISKAVENRYGVELPSINNVRDIVDYIIAKK